jgi:hypothetical protein
MGRPQTHQAKADALDVAFEEFEKLKAALGDDVSQLWADAIEFYLEVAKNQPPMEQNVRRRLARAAVLTAAAAFEAVTNFLSAQVALDPKIGEGELTQAEADCLLEKRRYLENGEVKVRRQIYKSKDRFLLLLNILGGKPRGKGYPPDLEKSFEVRDRLVHPKPGEVADILSGDSWSSAVLGFLKADLILALAWKSAKERPEILRRAFAGE